jgi:uncharacterized protein
LPSTPRWETKCEHLLMIGLSRDLIHTCGTEVRTKVFRSLQDPTFAVSRSTATLLLNGCFFFDRNSTAMATPSRTAFITGASSGIGAAFARQLAAEKYNLVLHGRRRDALEALCTSLATSHRISARYVLGELTNEEDLRKIEEEVRSIPDLHLLVNNAGASSILHFHEEPSSGQEGIVRVHIIACMRITHAAVQGMLQRGTGAIINVSSVAGFVIAPGSAVYCAVKSFLTSFTESLHLELGPRGITVQALCPGYTRTNFHERLGYDVSGDFFRGFMSADQVVAASLRDLRKGKVVSIPGLRYKIAAILPRFLPRRLLYAIVLTFRVKQHKRQQLVDAALASQEQMRGNTR